MAKSFAAAFSAEHLLPNTSGSGGTVRALLACVLQSCEGWDPADFLEVLTDDVSLPDSPPVDVVTLFRS